MLTIVDDSGLLGIVDCAAYAPFLDPDWTYEALLEKFADGMRRSSLVVWEVGDGGDEYRVLVRRRITAETGFREAMGPITVSNGGLNLVSYTALTMSAQFEDEVLPPAHEAAQFIALEPGPYRVRLVQTFDPTELERPAKRPNFIIEIEPGETAAWDGVVWESASAAQ